MGERHVTYDGDAPLLGGAEDLLRELPFPARDHHRGGVAQARRLALLFVPESARQVCRVDDDDRGGAYAGDHRLGHHVVVRALARRLELGIALAVLVLAPHLVLAHAKPPQPRRPYHQEVDEAEAQAHERRFPREPTRDLGHDRGRPRDAPVPGEPREVDDVVGEPAQGEPADDDGRHERAHDREQARARQQLAQACDGIEPRQVGGQASGREHAAGLHQVRRPCCDARGHRDRQGEREHRQPQHARIEARRVDVPGLRDGLLEIKRRVLGEGPYRGGGHGDGDHEAQGLRCEGAYASVALFAGFSQAAWGRFLRFLGHLTSC